MDSIEPQVVSTLSHELQEVRAERTRRLGRAQGRLRWGSSFTDDVILLLVNAKLAAAGAHTDMGAEQ